MDIAERISTCRGQDVTGIAAAFADAEQDDVTRALATMFGERTDIQALPSPTYAVGLTMYGDEDVSEWTIRYGGDGFTLAEGVSDTDVSTRWEHWEDGVRLLAGDVPALSLVYARRITTSEGQGPSNDEPAWFRAVDFAPGTDAQRTGRVITRLLETYDRGGKGVDDFTKEDPFQRIIEARALIVALALVESGCAEDLRGSVMRVTCAEDPSFAVSVDFGEASASLGEDAGEVGSSGVDLVYASAEAMIAEATGARPFPDLLVNGLVKVVGDEDRRARFGRSLMSFGRLHGL